MDAFTGEMIREFAVGGTLEVLLYDVQWAPDGNALYLIGDSSRGQVMLRADLRGNVDVLREDPTAQLSSVRPSPDGRYLAFGRKAWDGNVWSVEGFPGPRE
jgi:hypothetical protein